MSGMDVYVEFVILDNFVIDFLILLAVCKTLRISPNWLRLTFASLLGVLVAVVYPLLPLGKGGILLKLLFGFFIVLLSGSFRKGKCVQSYLFFLLYTFLMGGACIGILYLLDAKFTNASALFYISEIPVGLLLLLCVILFLLIKKLTASYRKMHDVFPLLRKLKIELFGRSIELEGFLDSGNRLYDEKSGFPILILPLSSLFLLLDNEQISELLFHGTVLGKRPREKSFSTVAGSGKMFLFTPEKVEIYQKNCLNKIEGVMLGVMQTEFQDAVPYDAILHPAMLERSL